MFLHLKQVDQLWHASALLDDLLKVHVWVRDELLNSLLVGKHTVLLIELEDSQVWLAWHQQSMLDNVDQTETKEVQWNMHELWSGVWHQSEDVLGLSSDLRVNSPGDLFLLDPEAGSLLCVEGLTLTDGSITQGVGHALLVLEEHLEEVSSEDSQVFLLEQLGVNLGQGVKLWIDLVLWNGALVSNKSLELCDLSLILELETLDVLLRDLHITLELKDVDEELPHVGQLLLELLNELRGAWIWQLWQHIEEHGVPV